MAETKMSNFSWLTSLRESIQLYANNPAGPILFAGVGQEQNGDDGAGPAVVSEIIKRKVRSMRFIFINTGAFPENHTSTIRKLKPALVVFIDAAQMNLNPGDIRLLELEDIEGLSASTHSLPFGIIGQYLQDEVGCRVMVLGIQPAHNLPNTSLSRVINDVVQNVAESLEALAKEYDV
jgi:hydrogenase 3 maturation protease